MAHLQPMLVSVFFGITILNALVMLYVWRIHFAERAIAFWTASFISAAAITGLQVFRLSMPDDLAILLFNLLSIIATLGLPMGVATFVGRPEPWRSAGGVLGLATVGIFYGTMVEDDLIIRLICYAGAVLFAYATTIYYLLMPGICPGGRARFAVVGVCLLGLLGASLRVLFSLPGLLETLSLDQFRIGEFWLADLIGVQILLPISVLLMMSERLMRKLEQQAHHDSLTGILNRRAFLDRAEVEAARAARHSRPAALLMLDIDHFKQVNDTYGHHAGDEVLRAVVAVIAGTLRKEDLFCRFGGEEFCLLLPEIESASAERVAERVRTLVADLQVLHEGADLAVTLSIGVSMLDGGPAGIPRAIDAADRALYRAKMNGRNRLELGPLCTAGLVPAST